MSVPKYKAFMMVFPSEHDPEFPEVPDSTWSTCFMDDVTGPELKKAAIRLIKGQARENNFSYEDMEW